MVLTPKGYRPRLIDKRINEYLRSFGVVSIEGPKWCGKTWTSRNQCNSEFQMTPNNLSLLRMDTKYALNGSTPRLIDEWQDFPDLWDEVRFEADRSNDKGRFILCGSSALDTGQKNHTGAGRIGTIRMGTMSLYESGDSDGAVSLAGLFGTPEVHTDAQEPSLEHMIDLTVRGGWPGLLGSEADPETALRDYIDRLCFEESFKIDRRTRNPKKFRMMLRSLARNESTVVSDAAIRRDVLESDNENISSSTIDDYRSVLERLNILWYQPAFSTNLRSSARIGKTSKKHLADPSLSMSLLGMNRDGALNDLKTYGFMFESLCARDLNVYAEHDGFRLSHYRDESGSEIDAVIERQDGSWGAIEVKLGFNQVDDAAENLLGMVDKFDRRPEFMCVLCGLAPAAFRRPDGVYVVPVNRLGP